MKKMLILMVASLILSATVQVARAKDHSPPGTEIAKTVAIAPIVDAIIPMQGIQIDADHIQTATLPDTRDHAITSMAAAMNVPFAPLYKQMGERPDQIPRE